MSDEHTDLPTTTENKVRRRRRVVTEAVDDTQQGMSGNAPARERVTAARHIMNSARDVLSDAVRDARGAGCTWHEIAAEMDIVATEDDDTPPGVRAFEWSLAHTRLTSAYWTCHTCQNTVADDGPYDANPANVEHGHTRECARAARDAEQYRQVLAEASLD